MHSLAPVLHHPLWQLFVVVEQVPPEAVLNEGAGVPNSASPRQKLMPLTSVHAKWSGQSEVAPQASEQMSTLIVPIDRPRHRSVVHCASIAQFVPSASWPGMQRPDALLHTSVPEHPAPG